MISSFNSWIWLARTRITPINSTFDGPSAAIFSTSSSWSVDCAVIMAMLSVSVNASTALPPNSRPRWEMSFSVDVIVVVVEVVVTESSSSPILRPIINSGLVVVSSSP